MLRVRGCSDIAPAVETLANRFQQQNIGKTVVVIGNKTSNGFEALFKGAAEVVMASRKATDAEMKKASEQGIKLVEKGPAVSGKKECYLYYDANKSGKLAQAFVEFCLSNTSAKAQHVSMADRKTVK